VDLSRLPDYKITVVIQCKRHTKSLISIEAYVAVHTRRSLKYLIISKQS